MAPCAADVRFCKEPSADGHGGKMLKETLQDYSFFGGGLLE
jgi:hypothetical protein